MHIDVRVEGLIMAYERTKEPHESWNHLNTPKLKNIPGQNYQELSKLKILGLNALTINCTQSAIPCIAFCLQLLFAFSLELTFGLPAVLLSWFQQHSVVSEVYSWLLQFANAVIAISFRIPRLVLINSHTTSTTFTTSRFFILCNTTTESVKSSVCYEIKRPKLNRIL